jgi:hypothetical protein
MNNYDKFKKRYPKGFFKGWTKAEKTAYFSGKLPKKLKMPLDYRYEGQKGLARIMGYELYDLIKQPVTGTFFMIFKLKGTR